MSISWSDQEKTLLEVVRSTLSTREIAELFSLLGLSRSVDAIQKQAKKLGIYFKDYGEPAQHGLTPDEQSALKKVISTRTAHLHSIEVPIYDSPSQKAKHTTKRREAVSEMLLELREIRNSTPRYGSTSTERATDKEGESLVVLLSDWHIGRNIVDSECNKTVYNIDKGIQRIEETADRVIGMFTQDELDKFDEVVVLLIGDHVDGEGIFPHHEMHITEHAAEQVLRCTKATWNMLQQFSEVFPLVRIVTTKGNHGRSGSSPEANWDNMVYQQLELLVDMTPDSNMTIKNRYGEFATVDIRGWKGLLRHKAPVQADTSAGIAKFAGWHGIHSWDFFCFGHFHHWGVFTWMGKPIFRNGSLPGGDDYAETLSYYDDPTQLCFGISEASTCTFVKPISYKD